MLIHIIQHVPFEKPGLIIEWIKDNNHSAEIVEIFNGNTLPKAEDVSFLIVLGGPMSANYSEEWIKEGRLLIKEYEKYGFKDVKEHASKGMYLWLK
jgi:GMP synthase (glutamine-hydrolysing)